MLGQEGSGGQGQWAPSPCTLLLTRNELALFEETSLPEHFDAFAQKKVALDENAEGTSGYYRTRARMPVARFLYAHCPPRAQHQSLVSWSLKMVKMAKVWLKMVIALLKNG